MLSHDAIPEDIQERAINRSHLRRHSRRGGFMVLPVVPQLALPLEVLLRLHLVCCHLQTSMPELDEHVTVS